MGTVASIALIVLFVRNEQLTDLAELWQPGTRFVLKIEQGPNNIPIRANAIGLLVIRPRSANTMRHSATNLAAHIRVALARPFSELAVFDARLYIRVRRIDEPA